MENAGIPAGVRGHAFSGIGLNCRTTVGGMKSTETQQRNRPVIIDICLEEGGTIVAPETCRSLVLYG